MRFPVLEPLAYNLPTWYARSIGIKRIVNSIHRRGGKDVNDFAMTVQDAIEHGGVHYYLFPTRVWAEDIIFKEQFTVDGETKPFWKWAIPRGLKAQKREKDCCIVFPHNGARIQLGGTDDLNFVGRGGKSYTMSEFSLHKSNVTGFIVPILRQSQASFRANGTMRGKANQLYTILRQNTTNPEWFVQWLKPSQTKCYCWVSDEYNINPELVSKIGQIGPNKAPIFNVQDDIDSGMISMALARQEYLNEADTDVSGAYYGYEINALKERGGIKPIHSDAPVYTFWDLGGMKEDSDITCITFALVDEIGKRMRVVDYYENKGHLRGHYFNILEQKGYRYAGHYFPHDGKRSNVWTGETHMDTAFLEHGVEIRVVPKTDKLLNDIEIVRRGFVRTEFADTDAVDRLLTHLGNYHEKEGTGKACHQNNCSECHGASHGADSFRTMHMALHLGLVTPYLEPKDTERKYEVQHNVDNWMIV